MIAKHGRMVAAAGNSVVQDLDPNAQTEVNAIRAACHVLGNLDLSGCMLHTSCECCPIFLRIRRSTASRSFRREPQRCGWSFASCPMAPAIESAQADALGAGPGVTQTGLLGFVHGCH